jgi:hypothetical protein
MEIYRFSSLPSRNENRRGAASADFPFESGARWIEVIEKFARAAGLGIVRPMAKVTGTCLRPVRRSRLKPSSAEAHASSRIAISRLERIVVSGRTGPIRKRRSVHASAKMKHEISHQITAEARDMVSHAADSCAANGGRRVPVP